MCLSMHLLSMDNTTLYSIHFLMEVELDAEICGMTTIICMHIICPHSACEKIQQKPSSKLHKRSLFHLYFNVYKTQRFSL